MLTVHSLACRRAMRPLFHELNFVLEPGGLLMVMGPNGSGKSTFLRSLAGLLPQSEGNILWQGENIADDPYGHRARLHYIGHLDALKGELTVGEMLDYWQALRGLPSLREKVGERPTEPSEKSALRNADPFDLAPLFGKRVKHLSAGQRRRLTLTRLVLGEAPLWLLDEPTTALDTKGHAILLSLIAGHRAKGGAVVLATHHDMGLPDANNLTLSGT